jgi:hypothetical protein
VDIAGADMVRRFAVVGTALTALWLHISDVASLLLACLLEMCYQFNANWYCKSGDNSLSSKPPAPISAP